MHPPAREIVKMTPGQLSSVENLEAPPAPPRRLARVCATLWSAGLGALQVRNKHGKISFNGKVRRVLALVEYAGLRWSPGIRR